MKAQRMNRSKSPKRPKASRGKTTSPPAAPPPASYLVIHGSVKEARPQGWETHRWPTGNALAENAVVTSRTTEAAMKCPPPPRPDAPPPLPTILEYAVRKYVPEVEKDAPAWAKEAARMVFKWVMPPERRTKASEKYLEGFAIGKIYGARELLPPDKRPPSCADYDGLTEVDMAAKLPLPDERADFFCGERDGEKHVRAVPERAKAKAERTKCFQEIAIGWREILASPISDPQGLHDWLLKKGLLASHKDSKAEARKICRLIGFAGRSEAGTPPEKK
jgi:hypothetical protein